MISIITPLHAPGNAFIYETYTSLLRQTYTDWEWLILENHGGVVPNSVCHDARVRAWAVEPELEGVGALKRACCERANGNYIFELDADDLLHPEALEKTVDAFEAGAEFVYSDVAEFRGPFKNPVLPFDPVYGWSSYLVEGPDGRVLNANRQPPITPQNMRYIDWSPNHLRAWTVRAYWSVGGHEAGYLVADDHDLVVRMYLAGKKFHHIPEALYYYRIHDQNTVKTRNEEIRTGTNVIYDRYIWELAEKFADDNGLSKVDLCCWKNCKPGYFGIDAHLEQAYKPDGSLANMQWDLNNKWPLLDDSCGVLKATDAIEHLRDPIHVMNEAYRVLAPGGFFLIDVPCSTGKGAFCDPTHVSFWNDLSFRYYTNEHFASFLPEFRGKFQVLRVKEYTDASGIPYCQAHLVAQKPGYEHMGPNGWLSLTAEAQMLTLGGQ